MHKAFSIILGLALTSACSTPPTNVTIQDEHGNYVTSSEFRKMERSEFIEAMSAGLEDYEERLLDLRSRANELGGDSLKEFADCNHDLSAKRAEFVNQMERTQATLAEHWPERREATLEAYYDLREALDEAYEEPQ